MPLGSPHPCPTLEEIRAKTLVALRRDPCLWQAKAVQQAVKGDKDVVCIAPTGAGKTLTFWMPLLFREDGIQIVVTPLNLLGTQNVKELASYGIRACDVRAETATPKLFQVSRTILVGARLAVRDPGVVWHHHPGQPNNPLHSRRDLP